MQLSPLATQFILEGRDHCNLAARGLLDLEKQSPDPEIINGIFRSFHTLKGTSGIFPEYAAITTLTQGAEELMDLIGNGALTIDLVLTDLFLAVLDQVGDWLASIESGGAAPDGTRGRCPELLAELRARKGATRGAGAAATPVPTRQTTEANPDEPVLHSWLASLDSEAALTGSEPEQAAPADSGAKKSSYIRIDQAHINILMDLVGEMIIAKNSLPYLVARAAAVYEMPGLAAEIDRNYGTIDSIVSRLQDTAIGMRMLPVSRAFERFPQLVRDISRKLDKRVRLVMTGEETHADKDVIDLLGDPLIHMVRNSLDHGLEPAAERLTAGKPEEGTLILRAFQDKSDIVVEIEDDGRGIDPGRIRRKAAARGVISAEAAASLSDEDALQLIMAPGFSGAEIVADLSDLSGRGVGMDAVQRMVTSQGGSVRAFSKPGQGSRMRLTLPLSMAISKILVVTQGDCNYGIPADCVVEHIIDVPLSRVTTVNSWPGLDLRGDLLPLYSLAAQLEMSGDRSVRAGFSAVVVRDQGNKVALAVDNVLDVTDVVVKPMAGWLQNNPYFTGSTILGDGCITFILHMQEVLKDVRHP